MTAPLIMAIHMAIVVIATRDGKPYALIQPISERDLEGLAWKELGQEYLRKA